MPRPATSTTAVTRAIVLGTLAALIVVGALSLLIYRSTLSGAVAQHSAQQLAMVRTAAIGVQGEIRGLSAAEDEDEVRRLVVATLGRAGYTVIKAGSGDETLRLAGGFNGAIHLLLSDVVMPGMNGPELAARLRATRPSIAVLLMSGYAADLVTNDDLKAAALLSKPFAPSLLVKTVRRILDQPLSQGPRPKG